LAYDVEWLHRLVGWLTPLELTVELPDPLRGTTTTRSLTSSARLEPPPWAGLKRGAGRESHTRIHLARALAA